MLSALASAGHVDESVADQLRMPSVARSLEHLSGLDGLLERLLHVHLDRLPHSAPSASAFWKYSFALARSNS